MRSLAKWGRRFSKSKQTPPAPFCLAKLPPDAILAAENPCATPGTLRGGEGGDGSNWLKILIARFARDSLAKLHARIVARQRRDAEGGSMELSDEGA